MTTPLISIVKKVQAEIVKFGGVPNEYHITEITAKNLDAVTFSFNHQNKTVAVRGKAAPNFMAMKAPNFIAATGVAAQPTKRSFL